MNRNVWIVLGIIVLCMAAVSIMLGLNLVTPMAEAKERGTIAGWWLVWTMITVSAASAVVLGGFLLAAGMGKVPETRG